MLPQIKFIVLIDACSIRSNKSNFLYCLCFYEAKLCIKERSPEKQVWDTLMGQEIFIYIAPFCNNKGLCILYTFFVPFYFNHFSFLDATEKMNLLYVASF